MNISLIYPARYMGYWPALGLAYVAAMLEKDGHCVQIIDRNPTLIRGGDVNVYTRQSLNAFKPDIIGITATTPLMEDVIHILPVLKEEVPNIPIVMGGPHVTSLPEETLSRYPEIDMVVRGEGELTMPEIVAGKPFDEILGITYRHHGKIVSNPPRPLIADLDSLPFPARHLFDMDFYLNPDNTVIRGLEGIRATHIYNARGCSHRCRFCAGAAVFGRHVRSNSPRKIVAEIQHLIDHYQIEALYFDEDVFFSTRKRAEAICSALIEAKIPEKIIWAGLMRADTAPDDILKMMKEAGCVHIEYGFESGSPRILKLINKGVSLQQNYDAARNTHKAGLRLLSSIVVGCPSETEADFDATLNFIRDTEPHFIGFNKFIPLPGSSFFDEMTAEGKLVNNNWDIFHVGGSEPHHEQISYSAMSGPAFFKKFSTNAEGFIRDANLVGSIISLLNTLGKKENGFTFADFKLQLFTLPMPAAEIQETQRYWNKVLESAPSENVFEPANIIFTPPLSGEARLAFFNNLGIYLMHDFRLASAKACLNFVLEEIEHPSLLANLGVLYFRRKDFIKADRFFTSALSKAGSYSKCIFWNYIHTLLLRGQLDAASEQYAKFDRDFSCFDGLMGQAVCSVLQGNFERAAKFWEKAFENTGWPAAKQNMEAARSYQTKGKRIIGFKAVADFKYL